MNRELVDETCGPFEVWTQMKLQFFQIYLKVPNYGESLFTRRRQKIYDTLIIVLYL